MASEIFEQDESDDDEDPPLRNPSLQGDSEEDDVIFLDVSQAKKAESSDASIMEYHEGAMNFCWTRPVRFDSLVIRKQ